MRPAALAISPPRCRPAVVPRRVDPRRRVNLLREHVPPVPGGAFRERQRGEEDVDVARRERRLGNAFGGADGGGGDGGGGASASSGIGADISLSTTRTPMVCKDCDAETPNRPGVRAYRRRVEQHGRDRSARNAAFVWSEPLRVNAAQHHRTMLIEPVNIRCGERLSGQPSRSMVRPCWDVAGSQVAAAMAVAVTVVKEAPADWRASRAAARRKWCACPNAKQALQHFSRHATGFHTAPLKTARGRQLYGPLFTCKNEQPSTRRLHGLHTDHTMFLTHNRLSVLAHKYGSKHSAPITWRHSPTS